MILRTTDLLTKFRLRKSSIGDEIFFNNWKRLSLLKTVNYWESVEIFPRDLHTVWRHDHRFIRSRFLALVPS
jgi:hypothetical protein